MESDSIYQTKTPGQKKYLSDNTKFKICAYWNRKPDGSYWMQHEKDLRLHRKYIDSFDYVNTKDWKTVTNHAEAFWKLLTYAQNNIANADKILIFLNEKDPAKVKPGTPVMVKQTLIASLVPNESECKFIVPNFYEPEYCPGHIYFESLPCDPLDEPTFCWQKILTKKPRNINHYLKQVA